MVSFDDFDTYGIITGFGADVGASCATSFASNMYALTNRPVGIIPCGAGGTTTDNWARVPGLSRSTLYGSMIARANEARSRGPLKGVIYYQGESNGTSSVLAAAFPAKFTQWVSDVRADLGDPNLPVVMVVIGPDPHNGAYPNWADVLLNQQQMVLPHNCARVIATDLSLIADLIHLATPGQVILGQRCAQAFHSQLGV